MTQFTRHHFHHFRPVPRVPPVDHPLSCYYSPSMNIRPCTSICWPYTHMKATGKHLGVYKMWIPVSCHVRKSCHPTDAESTSTTTFCTSPIHGHPPGRNSRLGLKASSPYCRLVVGSSCMLVQGIFTWRKLTRLNEPLIGAPEAETQIIHVYVGSSGCTQLACSVFRTSELKFHSQPIWQPIVTSFLCTIRSSTRLCRMSLRPLTYHCRECTYRVTPGKRICRHSSDWKRFSPRMPITFGDAQKTAQIPWWDEHAYRVGQLKWGQLTFLLIAFECVDKIQWFFGICKRHTTRSGAMQILSKFCHNKQLTR